MLDLLRERVTRRLAHLQIRVEEDAELQHTKRQQKTFEGRADPAVSVADQNEDQASGNMIPEESVKQIQIRRRIKSENRDSADPDSWGRVGRNELCPCDSGKKYKHCHGKIAN